ncbi:MAG TPA: glycosyltransferase [Solirubrobacteraceae bacterium]|jgi:rhamnosyltransferase|nr:glycosyltransferase [Solirubrobacteraceae bacterium]
MPDVSVVIPVHNGGALLAEVLHALSRQTVAHELVICDSGSQDESVQIARRQGARVLEIAPERFSHGGTRNMLVAAAAGSRVALLTQDATPSSERWLETLLEGFELAPDVALVYGPYRPRPEAPSPVRIELESWFGSLSPDGLPRVERLAEQERRSLPAAALIGRRGFFSDANACIDRAAWERTPFREIPYAEDRMLALDMLRAGHAKAYMPQAAVIHSHAYSTSQQLRRSFDEWRGLREVYGWREPASPRHLQSRLRGALAQSWSALAATAASPLERTRVLLAVACQQLASLLGALLGSRADRVPAGLRRRLSLEGRAGFAPLEQASAATQAERGPGSQSALR